jgi:hypothetical protein
MQLGVDVIGVNSRATTPSFVEQGSLHIQDVKPGLIFGLVYPGEVDHGGASMMERLPKPVQNSRILNRWLCPT